MMSSPPPQPEQREFDDAEATSAQYQNRPRPRRPAESADPIDSIADKDTQPTPALADAPAPPSAFANSSQDEPARRTTDAALTIDQADTQWLPSVGASAPPARPSVRPQRTGQPVQRRRRSARKRTYQIPPWVMRVALLVGLIVLGVRAGIASAAFMEPGGDILGWSQLPVGSMRALPSAAANGKPNNQLTPEQYAATLLPQLNPGSKAGADDDRTVFWVAAYT